ncbi:hypothetical protein KCP75_12495 [Salmonella enterica subsp. enterica]|nr:hypothetical protein KCP75_12495 [Salmonella enterica subsp. enterica]
MDKIGRRWGFSLLNMATGRHFTGDMDDAAGGLDSILYNMFGRKSTLTH